MAGGVSVSVSDISAVAVTEFALPGRLLVPTVSASVSAGVIAALSDAVALGVDLTGTALVTAVAAVSVTGAAITGGHGGVMSGTSRYRAMEREGREGDRNRRERESWIIMFTMVNSDWILALAVASPVSH